MLKMLVFCLVNLMLTPKLYAVENQCASFFSTASAQATLVNELWSETIHSPHYWDRKVNLALKTLGVKPEDEAAVLTALIANRHAGYLDEDRLGGLRTLVYALAEEQPVPWYQHAIHPIAHKVPTFWATDMTCSW